MTNNVSLTPQDYYFLLTNEGSIKNTFHTDNLRPWLSFQYFIPSLIFMFLFLFNIAQNNIFGLVFLVFFLSMLLFISNYIIILVIKTKKQKTN